MWPDQVSNPGPLTCESGALLTALRGPAKNKTYPHIQIPYSGHFIWDKTQNATLLFGMEYMYLLLSIVTHAH